MMKSLLFHDYIGVLRSGHSCTSSKLNQSRLIRKSFPGTAASYVRERQRSPSQSYRHMQKWRARHATMTFFRSSQNNIYYRQTSSGPILLEKALIDNALHALYACLELRQKNAVLRRVASAVIYYEILPSLITAQLALNYIKSGIFVLIQMRKGYL